MTMVDLTDFFSWTFVMHLSRMLILFNIVFAMLKNKYNTAVTFFSTVGVGLLYSCLSLNMLKYVSNEILLYPIFIIIEILVVSFVCEGSLFSKALAAIFGAIFGLLSNLIVSPILLLIGIPPKYFSSTECPLIVVLVFALCGYTFSFLAAAVIKIFQNKSLKKNGTHTSKAYILLLAPIIHLFSFLAFSSVAQLLDNNTLNSAAFARLNKSLLFISAICFITDALILFLVEYIDRLEYKNIENEKQIVSNTMTYQQTVLLNEEKKEFRKLKHDINNILTTAVGFLELGKTDKAIEILKETGISFSELGGTTICSNDLLNTIFSIKSQDASKRNVIFSVSVDENSVIRTDYYDLCRILNNLIDNSINAAELSEQNKKSEIKVIISNESISITTHNAISKSKNKNTRDIKHGYGIAIIKEIIKKYNGTYKTKSENNIYITETIIDNIQ